MKAKRKGKTLRKRMRACGGRVQGGDIWITDDGNSD